MSVDRGPRRPQQVGVARPRAGLGAVAGTEYAVHPGHVGVVQAFSLVRRLDPQCVETLFVLAPRLEAHEVLRAVGDALATRGDRDGTLAVAQKRLVQVEAGGVGDHGKLGAAVAGGVVLLGAELGDVVRLHARREPLGCRHDPAEPDPGRGSGGALFDAALIHRLEPVADAERRLGFLCGFLEACKCGHRSGTAERERG